MGMTRGALDALLHLARTSALGMSGGPRVWYVGLTVVSEDILFDSIAALGLMIAFYYGLTGFACPIYYRRELFKSARTAIMIGLAPLVGGLILAWLFVKSYIDLADPANSESGDSWFGLGPPLVIGVGFLLFGVVLMLLQQRASPEFFRRPARGGRPRRDRPQRPHHRPPTSSGRRPMAGDVIVGYDGSECAKGALSQTVEQARAFGAGLVIAFAYEPPAAGAEMADHRHALEERGKALTEEALSLVAGSGVDATAAVVDARPADGLLALADQRQARMIVVGTHGEPPIMGVVLGSTAYKLLHRSPVPLLVVRIPDA
jgi:nucleotide-binding universal stress UspA family protein